MRWETYPLAAVTAHPTSEAGARVEDAAVAVAGARVGALGRRLRYEQRQREDALHDVSGLSCHATWSGFSQPGAAPPFFAGAWVANQKKAGRLGPVLGRGVGGGGGGQRKQQQHDVV